jgi:glycosyltransferase involved in cell wall biosynthesis
LGESENRVDLSAGDLGRKPLVVVGIPAFNEERTIAKMILKARKHVKDVVVCDDGSTDLTGEIAGSLGAIVVRNARNLGKGSALRSLFELGRKINADVFVTLDADDQHEPDEIPKLVQPILKGEADVVIGNRFSNGDLFPARRRWGNRALNFLTNTSDIKDSQSGFRAYSRSALNSIEITTRGMGVDSQILIDAKKKNMRVVEVPISTKYPKGVKTSKKNFFQHGFEVALSIVELISEKRPLLYLGVPGASLFAVGGTCFIWVLNRFNEIRQFAIGTAILGVAASLLGGFLLFGGLILWVMGRQLSRLEDQLRDTRATQ